MPKTGENIYKRKDGRWEARFISGRKSDGCAKYTSVYARTYAAAKAKLEERKRMVVSRPAGSCRLTVKELFVWYLSQAEIKPSTRARYVFLIEHHIQAQAWYAFTAAHLGNEAHGRKHSHFNHCKHLGAYLNRYGKEVFAGRYASSSGLCIGCGGAVMIGQVEFYEKAGFQNILSERCYEYLVEKETIGVQIQKPMGMLLRFLRMCLANGEPLDHASKSAVECWNEKDINETPRNHYYRATEIRRFMQYLEKAGIDAYVDRDIRRVQSSFVPYIFSHSEIVRLFAAADGLPYTPISPQRVYVMSLLFRMLYGCGLRISEALNLVMADVDLDQGILYIRNSKFGKERLVPMSESLTFRCFQYVSNVGKHRKDEAAFFQTPCGGHYASGTILYAWRQTLYCAGISYGGKGKGPRIHDLRHTFAVHCLQKWVEAGEDLNAKLPYLSAYMGHAGLYSTQQYLRLTAEAFPHIVSAMEHNFDVFPGRQVEL